MSLASFMMIIFSLYHCALDSNIRKNLATKTPYAYVAHGDVGNVEEDAGCELKQVWMLCRHGTRYPNARAIELLQESLPTILKRVSRDPRVRIPERLMDNLISWKASGEGENPDEKVLFLHPVGELELKSLGARLGRRFPNLMSAYRREDFKFRATDTQRTQQSQFHFALGLFNGSEVEFETPPRLGDPLLRPYKTCPKWQRSVKRNLDTLREKAAFERSSFFQGDVLQGLARKLGINLSVKDIDAMYVACIFGQAWKPYAASPWCGLFSDSMLDALEYREDLKHYWLDSYGCKLNQQLGCVQIKDVVENFRNVTLGFPEEKGIFYFTHSGTMLKFLSTVGMFKDRSHLRSSNYREMRYNRKFRLSSVDSFASNIMFVLKQCGKQFFVGALHNENVVTIPGCGSTQWCPFESFESLFAEAVNGCDLRQICFADEDNQDLGSDFEVEDMH